jgi:hypothetical protein
LFFNLNAVEDNGNPGKTDYLMKIKDSSGTVIYTKAGILYKGNIQIHNESDKDHEGHE